MKLENITIHMMANHIIMMQLDSYMNRAGKREINPFEIALQSFSEIVEPMKSRHTYARTLEIRCKQSSRMRSQTFEKTLVEFGKIQKWLINDKTCVRRIAKLKHQPASCREHIIKMAIDHDYVRNKLLFLNRILIGIYQATNTTTMTELYKRLDYITDCIAL